MIRYPHGHTTLSILLACVLITGAWYASFPEVTRAERMENGSSKEEAPEVSTLQTMLPTPHRGPYVLINLETETLTINDGATTLQTIHILSQGKPASYYETIGGKYLNDYKELTHFSSIGHVYMPYSIHVFGNYFIHGVPYYPDGTEVSSTYSGGCIRLLNKDAKTVFDFVKKGTPIIITRKGEYDFEQLATSTQLYRSKEMTNLMVATISLEALTQDNAITGIDGIPTTRKNMLPLLLKNNDTRVSTIYAQTLGEKAFIAMMNQKARTLGLTNTVFLDVTSPVTTTEEEYVRFMDYISTYKSYLGIVASTTRPSL